MSQEHLTMLVRRFGMACIEARQVSQRLKRLLPSRLKDFRLKHRSGNSYLRAECQAFTDPDYLRFCEELLAINASAWEAKVQYDTHLMLIEARRSLYKFRSPSKSRQSGANPPRR